MTRPRLRFLALCLPLLLAFGSATRAQTAPTQSAATITINCASVAPLVLEGKPILDDAAKSLAAGQYTTAIDDYKNLIAKNIDVAYAYAGLVRVYIRQGDLVQAVAASQAGDAAAPGTVPVQVALGELDYRQGKIADAERAFDSACGNDAAAFIGLARIYEITGNYLMAANALNGAHLLAPDDPSVRYTWMYGSGNQTREAPVTHRIQISTPNGAASDSGADSAGPTADTSAEPEGCKAVSQISSMQLPMEPQYVDGPGHAVGAYSLKVGLDGTQSNLIVDTGSDGILVSHKVADRAGIKPLARQEISGLGDKGPLSSYVGYVKSVKIGGLELQGCYVTVSDSKSNVLGSDGLLGTIVFEDYLVDIDLPDGKLKLSPLPSVPAPSGQQAERAAKMGFPPHNRYAGPEMKGYTPVFRIGSDIVVSTAVNSHAGKLFVLDTGSFDDVITPATAKEVTSVSGEDELIVKGVNGTVNKVGTADRLSLTFGNLRQDRSDTVTLSLDSLTNGLHTEISGILGFGMLRLLDIKIDYRDALVSFFYNPNRLYH